eukprot:753024-Hanusia_phi.AAC.3
MELAVQLQKLRKLQFDSKVKEARIEVDIQGLEEQVEGQQQRNWFSTTLKHSDQDQNLYTELHPAEC